MFPNYKSYSTQINTNTSSIFFDTLKSDPYKNLNITVQGSCAYSWTIFYGTKTPAGGTGSATAFGLVNFSDASTYPPSNPNANWSLDDQNLGTQHATPGLPVSLRIINTDTSNGWFQVGFTSETFSQWVG